jgi:hypothetical protein
MAEKKTATARRRAARKPAGSDMRTLLVTNIDGTQFTIEVDAAWKITFSAFNPGSKYGGDGTATLRIYEAENKQRAVFRNVQSFHDVDLNVQLVAVEVEEYRHDDGAGNQLSERTERVRPMPVMPGR